MNENEYLSMVICERLESGSPLVLASIIGSKGSSPRHGGTKMVIAESGEFFGTIGGGILEATTLKEAKLAFTGRTSRFLSFEMLGNDALAPAPICGGQATLLLDYVLPENENIEFFQSLRGNIFIGDDFNYITLLNGDGSCAEVIGHALFPRDREAVVTCALNAENAELLKTETKNTSKISILPMQGITAVIDPVLRVKTLYCFGSGHVALPTVHIAAMSGFDVVVVDDRAEFASEERFPQAREVRVIEDFGRALDGITVDKDSFIVIITRGHQTDRIVLAQALRTGAGYIGMMGSKRKRDTIYSALLSQGFTQEDINRVHCPIGLQIEAEAPAEIAVSIVGELIAERARQRNESRR